MPFIFILGLAGFASALSLRSADPLLPVLALDLDVTLREAALLASAYTLPYAIMQLVLGPVGDAIGKTRLIRISLSVLTVALALSAIAPGYGTVLAARALAGAFAGGIIPASMALIGDRVAYAERQFSISRFLVAVISGQLAGSAVSGALAEVAGWRAVFGVSAVVAGLALIMTIVFLKGETTRGELSLSGSIARYRIVLQITLDGDSIQCTLVEMLPKSKPWGKPLRYRTMDSSCTFPLGSGVARDVSMSFEMGSRSFSLPSVPPR